MLTGNAGRLTATPPPVAEIPIREGKEFSLDEIVSIDMIRVHTKTEDIPAVTDEQIVLYRRAAFESAELYTGLLLMKSQRLEEFVKPPTRDFDNVRKRLVHRLRYAAAEPHIYVYGPGVRHMLQIEVGTRKVTLPGDVYSHLMFECCRPCGPNGDLGNASIRVMYLAGFANEKAIPAGIIVGVLKFIAWAIGNPGDEMHTVDGRVSLAENFLKGTNDGAWASGAIDEWRRYVNDVM